MEILSKKLSIFSDGKVVSQTVDSPNLEFKRYDIGIPVPDDGYQYVMAQHEIILFGTTRHSENKPTDRDPRPAVVNTKWGIETLAKANGDYFGITDENQRWFMDFWDYFSWRKLPMGKLEGTYINPKNPNITYSTYTKGSKLALYAGMIMDAKSHTDAKSPETGGRDIVTGRNLLSPMPWMWLCRPCTGALLRVISRNGAKLKIQAIDLYKPLPNVESLEVWQFYYGTQVDRDGVVTRYPDVKNAFEVHGLPPIGTAMPLVAPGGYFWIDRNACVELKPGQTWKPYYP